IDRRTVHIGWFPAGLHVSVILATILVLCSTVVADARTPAQACAAGKAKAAGKAVACELKCDYLAAKTGTIPFPTCLGRGAAGRARVWSRLGSLGGCATTGDDPMVATMIEALRADLEATLLLGGASGCTARAYRASGERASCGLKCGASAMAHGTSPDPLC